MGKYRKIKGEILDPRLAVAISKVWNGFIYYLAVPGPLSISE